MGKKLWCASPSDPVINQIARKYNLSQKNAKTVLNKAKSNDAVLQGQELTMDVLEASSEFKKALEAYTQEIVSTENALLKDVPGEARTVQEYKDQVKEDYDVEMTDDEAQEELERFNDIPRSVKISKKNARKIAAVLRAFPDARRMEFLGNWVCRALSEYVTRIQTDPQFRKQYKIKKQNKRIDYFTDTNAMNGFRAYVFGDESISDKPGIVETQANRLLSEGKTQLASELKAAYDNMETFFFLYGGNIFREEGIDVNIDGLFSKTDSQADSVERNEADTQDEDDEDNNDGENVVTTFSASDQNKSILTKMVPEIRTLLNTLHEKTQRGEDKTDAFGYGLWTYVSSQQAVNKLLRLCKGCETYSEMMKVLTANQHNTPWLTQLIGAMDTDSQMDASGKIKASKSKKQQLQTMFFQSFRKQFTRFRHIYQSVDENGDIIFIPEESNQKSKTAKLMNKVQTRYRKMKGMGIMSGGKLNPDVLTDIEKKVGHGERSKNFGEIGMSLDAAKARAKRLMQAARESGGVQDYKEVSDMLDKVQDSVQEVMKQLGIDATPQMLSDYSANDPMNRSAANIFGAGSEKYIDQSLATRFIRLQSLIKQVKNLNEKLKTWADSEKDDLSVSPFSRKVTDTDAAYPVRSAYRTLIANITEFSPDSFESQAHVNKKDYYSWNNPSSMLTVIERLKSGNREAVREYIRSKYCKDKLWYLMPEEGMGALRDDRLSVRTEKEGPVFYSDLLEALYYGNESQELDYSEVLQFSGETYNDMTDVSYALAMLSDYFTIQDFGLKSAKGHAWYRMFISGDKPRYVSVRLPRYSERSTAYPEKDFRNIISRKAVDFFAQELRRSENVFRYAATHRDGLRIQGYDVDPNDSKYKAVFDKRKYGKTITVEDVVKDGRYIFRNTGVSFFLNKFINEEIENNTPLGQYVVDRIFNSHMHREAREVVDVSIMDTFKQAFADYMKATRDKLLQHYQDIGLLAEKASKDEDGNTSLHLKYLIGNMRQWNIDIPKYGKFALATAAERDRLALEDGKDLNQKENKKYKTYYTEKAQFAAELEEYVYNNWLAKANMSELFDVDLAFYGDTPNFQKRNAQVVSSGHITDPEARIHDEKVSDGFYRTITLLTTKTPSEQLDQIEQLLMRRLSQITDPLQRKQFEIGIKDTISKLKKQDTTDGQAFVGLTALRKRRAGQGEWSISDDSETDDRLDVYTDEAVYRRMKKGYKGIPEEVKTNDMLHVFAQVQKDFVYTTDHFEREGRGTISVPVQHKNSEYMLSFLTAFAALENPGSQLEAIARFLEETAEDDITTGIDTVNFDSAVKIGGNNKAIDLSGKTGAETLQILRKSVYKDPKVRTKENYRPGVVTVYDNKDYKIVQEKPEHYKNTQQPTGSQFKILAINNIPDTAAITLPNGKKITGKELKQRYFSLLRYKTKSMEADFRKSFGLRRPASKRLHKLSVALKNAMSTDRKFTVEMRRSLSIVERDGIDRFVTPLDEPGIQSAVEALLMSKTRRAYYKQRTNGGIAVQAASWGKSKKLNIRFYSSDPSDTNGILKTFDEFKKANPNIKNVEEEYKNYKKNHQQGYAYFEIEAPMPTYVREMIQNPDGSITSYFLNEDGSWNMKELRKVLPDSVFDAICYRVPTEAKYSIMACRIVQFGKENSGSELIFPEELTTFTGSDFDIDTDTVELRPAPSQKKNKDIDNELFDLELAALRSDPAIGETFKPGDFSDLSEASYYMTLLESGLYTKEQLDEMDPKTWKELCKQVEDLDLMSPMTDIILHNQNSDAKSMIGIAAVGVTSHAFMSLYNDVDTNNPKRDPRKNKKNFLRMSFKETDGSEKVGESFTVLNDKDKDRRNWTTLDVRGEALLDMMYDMDGKLISTEISKYVGASADAAKDAALYRLGLNQRTLPIAILMHRLGISSDVIRAFMKQPIIKDLLYRLNMPTDYGKISIAEACRSLREDMMRSAFAENTEKERQAMLKKRNERN